jgi:D-sedoheptulose 7-phosphate isomerase
VRNALNPQQLFVKYKLRERERTLSSIGLKHIETLVLITKLIFDTYKSGSKVLIFGNGGSAAESQHFAAELVGRFHSDRAPFNALALNSDTAILTAISNDFGYDHVFARQVRAYATKNDLIIGFSTSGKSASVLNALQEAISLGCKVVLFSGDSKIVDLIEKNAIVVRSPSLTTAVIQEVHLSYVHLICEMLDLLIEDNYIFESLSVPSTLNNFYTELGELEPIVNYFRKSLRLSIGFINGCFDILHEGHLELLVQSRKEVDILVVALNSDTSVRALKGESRPILSQDQRARALLATGNVDFVLAFEELTPVETIKILKPAVVFKGSEYSHLEIPERPIVESYGGKFHFIKAIPSISTSKIISLCRMNLDETH